MSPNKLYNLLVLGFMYRTNDGGMFVFNGSRQHSSSQVCVLATIAIGIILSQMPLSLGDSVEQLLEKY